MIYKDCSCDEVLWNEFRLGEDQAFIKIYNNFINLLFHYGIKFTPDDQLVKDCIQELFIELYNNRKTLGHTNNIRLYLHVSLKRKIIKTLKFQKLHSSLNETDLPFLIEYVPYEAISDGANKGLNKEKIQKALRELPPRQKEAIYLKFNSGLSYEEISEVMDMKYQSIRNLIFRAMEKLRSTLTQTNIILFTLLKNS